jgi:hypothetical protein
MSIVNRKICLCLNQTVKVHSDKCLSTISKHKDESVSLWTSLIYWWENSWWVELGIRKKLIQATDYQYHLLKK